MAVFMTFAHADALKEEFSSLKQSREGRGALVSYLKSTNVAKEGVDGLLRAGESAHVAALKTIEEENKDRERMFVIIAEMQNTNKAAVAKQFAERMGVDTSAPQFVTTLRVHG